MLCRSCDKVKQNRKGCLYCTVDNSRVKLNDKCKQPFYVPKLDELIFDDCGAIDLHKNIRLDIDVEDNKFQIFNINGNLNVVSREFNTELNTTLNSKEVVEICSKKNIRR